MKLAAAIQAKSVTSDSNAQNDSGAYLQFFTKAESGSLSERVRIDSRGNIKSGTVGSALNFTDSNAGKTKSIEVGASGGGDALLVTHSSGYGVGYFGYEAGGDRLVIACDGGSGNNKIDFITDAGTSTGGGTDNLNAKVPKMRITSAGAVMVNKTSSFGTVPLQVVGASSGISDGGQIFDIGTANGSAGTD